jgi:hypothetical protein
MVRARSRPHWQGKSTMTLQTMAPKGSLSPFTNNFRR